MKVALSLFTVLVLQIHFRQLDCFSAEQVIVKIDAYPNTSEVEQGTTVVLVCRVVGVPYGSELTYSWTCASGRTCDNPSVPPEHGSRRQYNNTVVVDIVHNGDNGDYQCSVSNRSDGVMLGSDIHRIRFTTGMSIYIRPSKYAYGIYFPRNSFVTDGTPILIERNTKYRIHCYSTGQVFWYYRNGTKPSSSGHSYSSHYISQYKVNLLTRLISLNPSNEEFYSQGNERTAWFGMFVNPNTTSLTSTENLSVTQVTQHSITLSWTSVSRSSGYYISYERLDFSVPVTPTYMRLGGSDNTSVALNKLTAGTRYMIRVWATDGSGVNQPIEKTVKTEDDIPSPPRLMIITRNIENGVELSWLPPVNPNGVIISYEIEYTTNSAFTTINETELTQNSLTHYNWTGPEFPTYYMRVRAVTSSNTDTGRMSEPSNNIKLCLGLDRAPDDPTGLRGITEKASTTSVYIEWDESPPTTCDGVTWYELSYTMDKNFMSNVTNITTNKTHYNLTELVEYTTLYITLVAVNAVGKSDFVELTSANREISTTSKYDDCKMASGVSIVGGVFGGFFGGVVLTSIIAVAIHVLIMRSTKKRISGKENKNDHIYTSTDVDLQQNPAYDSTMTRTNSEREIVYEKCV